MAAVVTAATSGGTFANDATVGTINWDTPSNASASDDTRASAILLITEVSKYLKATNFGFSIPTGSTIRGIVVEVEKSSALASTSEDNSVKIVQDGTIGGTEQKIAGAWGTSDAYSTYGSATDLWGLTWTAEQINASNFGVVIAADATAAATARIDHIRITIHYTDLQANFEQNYNILPHDTDRFAVNNGTITYFGFNFRGSISLNTVNLLLRASGAAVSQSFTLSLGLYSITGSSLSLANSASFTSSFTTNRNEYISLTATSATQNITPGTWYFGLLCSTSGGSTFSFYGQSTIDPANAFPGGFIGGGMTDSTNALPGSYATSNLDITGGDALNVPVIIISA